MQLVPYHRFLIKEYEAEILKEFWQVSGSAVIDENFHNQFEWAPCTNGVATERGTSRPRHRWRRLFIT